MTRAPVSLHLCYSSFVLQIEIDSCLISKRGCCVRGGCCVRWPDPASVNSCLRHAWACYCTTMPTTTHCQCCYCCYCGAGFFVARLHPDLSVLLKPVCTSVMMASLPAAESMLPSLLWNCCCCRQYLSSPWSDIDHRSSTIGRVVYTPPPCLTKDHAKIPRNSLATKTIITL